jgi:hypothetical protein
MTTHAPVAFEFVTAGPQRSRALADDVDAEKRFQE